MKWSLLLIVGLIAAAIPSGQSRHQPLGPAEHYWLLNRACAAGDELAVQMLLNAGADPTGVHGFEAFHKSRYQRGFEPSWPINVAAYAGHARVVQLLLAAGATVDAPEGEGQTALMLAASKGHPETVKLLLESGADTAYRAGPGEFVGTAEEVALRSGHKDIAQIIRGFRVQP